MATQICFPAGLRATMVNVFFPLGVTLRHRPRVPGSNTVMRFFGSGLMVATVRAKPFKSEVGFGIAISLDDNSGLTYGLTNVLPVVLAYFPLVPP